MVGEVNRVIDILFDVTGQSLYFDAPTRPQSVTSSTVYENISGDESVAESATTGSPAVETNPDTTTDATSGAGQSDPSLVSLTATTGVAIGRAYLLTSGTSESEWVEVEAIDDGVSVTAKEPLHNTYGAGSSFESTRITHGLLDAWIQEQANVSGASPNPRYRWRIVYVDAAGATQVAGVYFDLVRYPGGHSVRGIDVERTFPGFINALPTYDREDQGQRLVDAAFRQVKVDLHAAGKADEMARNSEILDELVMWRANYLARFAHAMSSGGGVDLDIVELAKDGYQSRLDSFVRVTTKIPFDSDSSGGASSVPALPITRR